VDLTQLPERRMRQIRGREIAMIFQDPMSSLNPVFTVGDQISEAIITHQGRGHSEARAEATRLLRLVGIPAAEQRLSEYPHRLSGGMRQRVMIAMALACDPQVLIADEPTTALDVTIQQQIVSLLDKLRHERQLGIIFITHDLRLVAEIAQRVAVMYCGQIVEEGPAQKVLSAPRHPYTVALLRCLPTARASGPLEAISGAPADPVHPPQGCRFHPRCPIATDACRRDAVPLFDLGGDQQTRCLRTSEVQALQ
jgi:oligopeptide/dipeptide ABC transporter ATP-binding protein